METLERVRLFQLALIMFRIGCLSWGGGGATLAMLHAEFCVRRRIVTEEEFQVLFGISRVVPGMNLLSLTVLLGYRSHGLTGGLIALTALTIPSFSFIILGCYLFRGGHPNPFLAGAIRGLGPAAAALLLHTGWQLCRGSLKAETVFGTRLWIGVLVLSAFLTGLNLLPTAWVVLLGGMVGIAFAGRLAPARGAQP